MTPPHRLFQPPIWGRSKGGLGGCEGPSDEGFHRISWAPGRSEGRRGERRVGRVTATEDIVENRDHVIAPRLGALTSAPDYIVALF